MGHVCFYGDLKLLSIGYMNGEIIWGSQPIINGLYERCFPCLMVYPMDKELVISKENMHFK